MLGYWIAAEACFIGVLAGLAIFAWRRVAARHSGTAPPTEFVWIPIGILHGIIGTVLLMLGQAGVLPLWALATGRPMAQQGFLFSVVLGVGGFMAPRLMGRTTLPVTPGVIGKEEARRIRMRRVRWHALAGLALFVTFWIEGAGAVAAAYRLRALLVTAELAWTSRFYRPPSVADRYVQLVWISLWMMVLGFWGAGLFIRFRVAMLHLAFIGGLSLMAFAVATMVVMSHAGEGRRLRQPLWVLRVVGVGVAIAMVVRVIADAVPALFFQMLGMAAAAWAVAGISWLVFALQLLVRRATPEAFEQLHEEAKRRLLKQ